MIRMKLKKRFALLLLLVFTFFNLFLEAKLKVDIITYSTYATECIGPLHKLHEKYDLTIYDSISKYFQDLDSGRQQFHKAIFIEEYQHRRIASLPVDRLLFFKWEAIKIRMAYYENFGKIYTFDDDLINDSRVCKFGYPSLQSMLEEIPSFSDKKFLTMVVGNWCPPERRVILNFFATKYPNALEFYGTPPRYEYGKQGEPWNTHPMWKGRIYCPISARKKHEMISKYRFCICFENTHNVKGYITEKIFDVFAAGCVPVYWGPENVTDFIPKNCFIDYRQFSSNEQMYTYLKNMTEYEYNEYINNIKNFLNSDEAKLFSRERFEEILLKELET